MCLCMMGKELLVPSSLQGTVVQTTGRSSLTVLTEVLRFKKKKKNKNLYFGFHNLENYSLYWLLTV